MDSAEQLRGVRLFLSSAGFMWNNNLPLFLTTSSLLPPVTIQVQETTRQRRQDSPTPSPELWLQRQRAAETRATTSCTTRRRSTRGVSTNAERGGSKSRAGNVRCQKHDTFKLSTTESKEKYYNIAKQSNNQWRQDTGENRQLCYDYRLRPFILRGHNYVPVWMDWSVNRWSGSFTSHTFFVIQRLQIKGF